MSTNTACANAEPDSPLARFCQCQVAVKSVEAQYQDYLKRKEQFKLDMAAYTNSISAHNTWVERDVQAKVNPTPYASYSNWLANNPEPVVLDPPSAPSFIADASAIVCCSQRFNNITVPDGRDPTFNNVVQKCSSQLSGTIRQLSLNNSASASTNAGSDLSGTTSGNEQTDISSQNGSTTTTTSTTAPDTRKQDAPLWVVVVGVIALIVVLAALLNKWWNS